MGLLEASPSLASAGFRKEGPGKCPCFLRGVSKSGCKVVLGFRGRRGKGGERGLLSL